MSNTNTHTAGIWHSCHRDWSGTLTQTSGIPAGILARSKESPSCVATSARVCVGVARWSRYEHSHTAADVKARVDFTVTDDASVLKPDFLKNYLKSLMGWECSRVKVKVLRLFSLLFSRAQTHSMTPVKQQVIRCHTIPKNAVILTWETSSRCSHTFVCSWHILSMHICTQTHSLIHAWRGFFVIGMGVYWGDSLCFQRSFINRSKGTEQPQTHIRLEYRVNDTWERVGTVSHLYWLTTTTKAALALAWK